MGLERFAKLAKKSMTPVSMKTLLDSGTGRLLGKSISTADTMFSSTSKSDTKHLARLQIASFLRRECPIRLSHRIFDLERMPFGLNSMSSIKSVQQNYIDSCDDILGHPIDFNDDSHLRNIFWNVYDRHKDTLFMIACGLQEFQKSEQGMKIIQNEDEDFSSVDKIHSVLDDFFMTRIGFRVLIGHYLELHAQNEFNDDNMHGNAENVDDFVGIINRKTSPANVVQEAARDASYMCERQYGDAPEVQILGRTDLTFSYVPSHLYYILFELLKNSMRAVAEHHSKAKTLPPIKVIVADGEENEDVVIKISDLGGGIPRSNMKRIFSYLFTTASYQSEKMEGLEDFGRENPLAGLGYGLPISRLYVKYFGGDLQLKSMEGYGTDSFLHLSRLTDNEEPLP